MWNLWLQKKVWLLIFFHPSLLLLFLDPGIGMGKNQDPESGINILDAKVPTPHVGPSITLPSPTRACAIDWSWPFFSSFAWMCACGWRYILFVSPGLELCLCQLQALATVLVPYRLCISVTDPEGISVPSSCLAPVPVPCSLVPACASPVMIVVSVPTYKPISCLCLHLYISSVSAPDLGAIGSADLDPGRQK